MTTRAPSSLLVERAADFLAVGPAAASVLVAHVCQLPGVPDTVADHMASALLGAHHRFERHADGRWALRAAAGAEPAVPCTPALPLRALSYVVVDLETTGGRPDHGDRVTEVAAVVVRDGQIVDRWETLVNPERPIPPFITQLTNISWAMVKDAPRFREVCDRLVPLLEGNIFVAHNVSFDWRFLAAEIRRATGRELDGRRLCTVRLARKLLPQLRRRSLDMVAAHYGIEIAARHRAMGDAEATAHALLRMLREAEDRGCSSWSDLEALLAPGTARRARRGRAALPQPSDDRTA